MNSLAASPVLLSAETEPADRRVHVQVTIQTGAPVDAARLESAVCAALAERAGAARVSVAVVDDATIHRLNRQFLAHDYPTDVLSFALDDQPGQLEGEIVVSAETAQREARAVGWSPADELLLYVVHGALHLAGFGDKDPAAAAAMQAAEAAVLDRLGVERSPSDPRWRDVGATQGPSEEQAR